uniref:Uncharacterized protein n=1 Tax=Salix viminalis TaxID=40686 RepID=A0A6N2LMT5_SALVM
MLMIEKSHKFGIILHNLMVILKFMELNSYACHAILNGTSNMWSHLKVKKFLFVVDKKQKLLVLEPKKKSDESEDKNMGTLKAIGYKYDEYRLAL